MIAEAPETVVELGRAPGDRLVLHAEPSGPRVTVVVVPREGFRVAPQCLSLLLEQTAEPFELVYVDTGSPKRISAQLRALVATHGGTFFRIDRYLRPTTARNLGLEQVVTPYTVFLDNDVVVTQDWLSPLLDCAEDTGAAFVSPIIYEGDEPSFTVHFAGGDNRVEVVGGRRRLIETYQCGRLPQDQLVRRQTELAEFHAVLVRTDAIRSLGGLDERCPTAFEHNDLCLSIAEQGGSGWVEPSSVVSYLGDRPTALSNAAFHAVRWSRFWIRESLAGMCEKWELEPDDPMLERDLKHLHQRRRRPFRYVRGLVRRLVGRRIVEGLDRVTDAGIDALTTRIERNAPSIEKTIWPTG